MKFVADSRQRLDKFLSTKFPEHSRSRLQKLIDSGNVLVEGKPAEKNGLELREGWVIEVPEIVESAPQALEPWNVDLDIRYEDAFMLVVNKSRGVATHPASSLKEPSLVNALLARSHNLSTGSAPYRPGIVHRLDKDTTGLIMIAKTDAVHANLAKQIAEKTADRIYVALADGEPLDATFSVNAAIGRHPQNATIMAVKRTGKPALTHFRLLKQIGSNALLACKLSTGRTHQIRVHLSACNLPVVGDPVYGRSGSKGGSMQLHAALMRLNHPVTGERLSVFAEPPEDFLFREYVIKEEVENWN